MRRIDCRNAKYWSSRYSVPEDADEGVQLAGFHVPVQQPADRPQLRLRGDQPGQGHELALFSTIYSSI